MRGENSYERPRRGFALKGAHAFFASSATCENWATGDGCDKVRNKSSTRFDTPSLSKILRRSVLTRYQKGRVAMIKGSTRGSFRRQLLKFATLFAAVVLSGSFAPALFLQKALAPHSETRKCGASSLPITTPHGQACFQRVDQWRGQSG